MHEHVSNIVDPKPQKIEIINGQRDERNAAIGMMEASGNTIISNSKADFASGKAELKWATNPSGSVNRIAISRRNFFLR